MSQEIVVYANDLNQVALGSLKEQEQNLFFSILVKLKNQGHEPIIFSAAEISQMLAMHYTTKQITAFVKGLKDNFFKLDFSIVTKFPNGSVADESINLFKRMVITYTDESKTVIKSLTIEVNEQFEYMLNQLKANFTSFELASFLTLRSKYSKTLFRLLKQFKSTGKAYFEWDRFKELMGVPKAKAYTSDFTDRKIIKPSVKELSWDSGQPDLFTNYHGMTVPFFRNLTYRKIKKNPRAKTSPIVAIEFTWQVEKLIESQAVPVAETAVPVAEK